MIFPFWLQTKKWHNFTTSQKMPLLNFTHFAFHLNFWNAKLAKTFFFFGESFLFGGVTTIQVDYFNHPGSRIPFNIVCHHANGMLLPGDHLQPMGFLEVELKPATPRATIHPRTTLCLPLPATARCASALRHATVAFVGFFCWGFPGIKGVRDEGNEHPSRRSRAIPARVFFVQQMCPMWQMLVGQFRIFRFRGDCNNDIPITKRR